MVSDEKKNCWLITIAGFKAIVDPRGIIIQTEDRIKALENEYLYAAFEKYKKRVKFKKVEKVEYPYIVSDDIYNKMFTKNPKIENLRMLFECEIF